MVAQTEQKRATFPQVLRLLRPSLRHPPRLLGRLRRGRVRRGDRGRGVRVRALLRGRVRVRSQRAVHPGVLGVRWDGGKIVFGGNGYLPA